MISDPVSSNVKRADRRPRWQFSLRELLLLTTTIAVLVGFIAMNLPRERRTLSPSRLATEFGLAAHFHGVLQKVVPNRDVPNAPGEGGWGPTNPNGYRAHRTYYFDLPPEHRTALLKQLELDARAMMAADALDVRSYGTGRMASVVTEFHMSYSGDRQQGHLNVQAIELPDQTAIVVDIYEHLLAE